MRTSINRLLGLSGSQLNTFQLTPTHQRGNVRDEMASDNSACGKRKRKVLSLESKLVKPDRLKPRATKKCLQVSTGSGVFDCGRY